MMCLKFMKNVRFSKIPAMSVKYMSSDSSNLCLIEVNDKTGISTLTLNRPPVNGFNIELLSSLKISLLSLERNKSRGIILTSSSDKVFSGGLDILEMYKPDVERLKTFWTAVQDVWLVLYGLSAPTAAAINGHSPAGGCILASSCEYRVMLPNFTIGLNETQLGIVAPSWFMSTYLNVLPRRAAEMALTQGKMFNTDEALKIGLIDEVAKDKTEAIQQCEKFLNTFAKINPIARALTKRQFRKSHIQELEMNKKSDLDAFVNFTLQPSVQKGLQMYMDSLKNKSKM